MQANFIMKKYLLSGIIPLFVLCGCAQPPPPQVVEVPVYVNRTVVVHPHSDSAESFRAIEKPSTYSR